MSNPQIFGAGIFGKSRAVTAMRRLNCYYDIQQDPDRTEVAIHGMPGFTLLVNLGATRIRGMRKVGSRFFVAHRDNLYQVFADGSFNNLGTLDTTEGQVYFSDNGTQVMLVDGQSGYIWNIDTAVFAKITDGDFPGNPTSVTFMNGFFIVTLAGNDQFFISALVDGLVWDALDFDSAFVEPDDLVAAFAYGGVLGLFGELTTEYWSFTGAADFPFGRIIGASYGWGLAARASLATFGTNVICLAQNRLGEAMVTLVTGGEPVVVSPSDLVKEINGYIRQSDAVGFSFMLNGHMMYQISFPSAAKTWLYDQHSGLWSEMKSFGVGNHRGLTGEDFAGAVRMGDFDNGKLYTLDQDTFTGDGDPLEMELISKEIHQGNDYFRINQFQVDMEEGQGTATGQGSDPQVMLSMSTDKGNTFGNELWVSAGKIGEYRTRVKWRKLGRARQVVFKLRITDPIKRVITSERIMLGN